MNHLEYLSKITDMVNKSMKDSKLVTFTLVINGINAVTVKIPIENERFELNVPDLHNDFENWITEYFV